MYKNGIKRIFDFCLALVAILVLSPVILVVSVWLYIANNGADVFFIQERPGKGERIFKLYKFKSMTDEKDAEGNLLPDSVRLTKIGRFIRKTSIDELPQLLNVLKGDMSIIGPRPLLVSYLPYYNEKERLRHSIRPGITGLAQVKGRNTIAWDDRLQLDVYYAEHISFCLDIKIFFMSFYCVMASKNVSVETNQVETNLKEERMKKDHNV
ncbi:sugar transferase [Porphyromonas sp. COT-052 OH4946]|uniref:sugar transferase n=1 Tax=Porphyromonas sp. COT-052 OH4946 TaxID=1515618 RepID=UPI00051D0738|nr:sugar transferase [Porphyromonas sp. COT-052 OH4946]KGL56215.1 sugar transferase [Porphyromonas sp. COT-052 OH4946]